MSAGNGAGIEAFSAYRAFDKPLVVQFGKRGATAPALGFGDLSLHGKGGPETLRGVLYVPELVVSLISVRAAVSAGMNISFCPATSGSAQVLIKRRGQLILTASEQDSLSTLICQVASLALLAQN
jgi:hypothetical protein